MVEPKSSQPKVLASIPKLVKHMTVAIYASGDIGGKKETRFKRCLAIARSRLAEYGLITQGSAEGPVDQIKLTGKGLQKERKHASEGGSGRDKTDKFDSMFAWVQAMEPGLEIPGKWKNRTKKAEAVSKEDSGPPGLPKPKVRGARTREEALTQPLAKKPKW